MLIFGKSPERKKKRGGSGVEKMRESCIRSANPANGIFFLGFLFFFFFSSTEQL